MNKNNEYSLFGGSLSEHLHDKVNINHDFINKIIQKVSETPSEEVVIDLEEINSYEEQSFEVTVIDLIYYLQNLLKCQVVYNRLNTIVVFKKLKPSLMTVDSGYPNDNNYKPILDELVYLPTMIVVGILTLGLLVTVLLWNVIPVLLSAILSVGCLCCYYFDYHKEYKNSVKVFNYINNRLK